MWSCTRERRHLFEPFAQGVQASDRALGGLGLGLTIVETLVRLQGGQVEAHSAGLGQGAEFVVRLPASAPRAPKAINDPGNRDAPVAPRLSVLVVDDNEDGATLLAELLGLDGHEVVVALDGASALRARMTFVPDVALLDIGLPLMDGYELARRLRADYPADPLLIIAISGYAAKADRMRSRLAGMDEHLAKPVDIEHLRQLLQAAALSTSV